MGLSCDGVLCISLVQEDHPCNGLVKMHLMVPVLKEVPCLGLAKVYLTVPY